MGEFVDQNEILRARKRRDDAGVGEIAGTEHTGRFGSFEPRQPRLELAIQGMIAGDEPRCASADAIGADRRGGGRLERRMMGKVQVIIAGEGQKAAAVALDPWAALAQAIGKRAPQKGAIELFQFAASKIIQGAHWPLAFRDVESPAAPPPRNFRPFLAANGRSGVSAGETERRAAL